MMNFLEVTNKDIENLSDHQLTDLLRRLLHCEAAEYDLPQPHIDVPQNITIADGGKDGRITWSGGPDTTARLKRNTLIQIKATEMGKAKCKAEMLFTEEVNNADGSKTNSTKLLPKIESVLNVGGRYMLFCNHAGRTDDRVEGIREALKHGNLQDPANADVVVYDPTMIAAWTNKYFPAVIAVKRCLNMHLPLPLLTWSLVSEYGAHTKTEYITTALVKQQMDTIASTAAKGGIVRVVGLSGLGKTRLVIESFRADITLRERVAFVDAADMAEPELLAYVTHLVASQLSGVLVVDNCSSDLHTTLSDKLNHSNNKMSLVTLDYTPDTVPGSQVLVEVLPAERSIIEGILAKLFPGLLPDDVERIIEFSEGHPQIAILLSTANLTDPKILGQITDKSLVKKLLWERGAAPNDKAEKVIVAASLFTNFGFSDGKEGDRKFIASKICDLSDQEFHNHAKSFIKRGVLQQVGAFVRVTPRPLAWRLAAQWWEDCADIYAEELIKDDWPPSLSEAMCSQLEYLSDSKAAHTVAEKLCQPNCPFVSAEQLNSKRGSRLFCAIATVDHNLAVNALTRTFAKFQREDFLKIGPGRRYLTWALEKLVFPKETFEKAALLLAQFASAETESISNNATGIFSRLFQIALAGTEASLKMRIQLADAIFSTNDSELIDVCTRQLTNGFKWTSFNRMSYAEKQGRRLVLVDYVASKEEIHWYWEQLIDRLLPMACGDTEIANFLQNKLSQAFRLLIANSRIDLLERIIVTVISKRDSWPEAASVLKLAMTHEASRISEDSRPKLHTLLETLEPKNFQDKFHYWISVPPWNESEKNEQGVRIDLGEIRAKKLALDIAPLWPEWEGALRSLLVGEQRKAFLFGKYLSANWSSADVRPFINKCLELLKNVSDEERPNASFLGGYLVELKSRDPETVKAVMNEIYADGVLCKLAVPMTCFVGVERLYLEQCVVLVRNKLIKAFELNAFAYGSVLSSVDTEAVATFAITISDFEHGRDVSLRLLFMYTFQRDKEWMALKSTIRQLLMMENDFDETEFRLDIHEWDEMTKRLLTEDTDSELAAHTAKELGRLCKTAEMRVVSNIDQYVQFLLQLLIEKYLGSVWQSFSDALLSDDWSCYQNATILLMNTLSIDDYPGAIFRMPEDALIKWCHENKPRAVHIVARHVPLFDKLDDKTVLHPLARRLIEDFGKDDGTVLSELSANLGTYSFQGTAQGPLIPRIEILKPYLEHQSLLVRNWAEREIEHMQSQLDWWSKRNAEMKAGIFDGFTG